MCENSTIGEQAEMTNVGRTGYTGREKNTDENEKRVRDKGTKRTGRPGDITCGRTVWLLFKQVIMHEITRRDDTGKGNDER